MSLHDDERLLAAVAAALGETIALDLAAYGIDWDAGDDSRLRRPARRLTGKRIRRRVA
jgi:hypothetical protein